MYSKKIELLKKEIKKKTRAPELLEAKAMEKPGNYSYKTHSLFCTNI